MAKLKIEALDGPRDVPVNPEQLEIKIFDGDKLVVETTLDAMVKKFLVISTQYMQALEIIAKVQENQEAQEAKSKIILPGNE